MALQPREKAILALSDGTVVHGFSVGYKGITGGELCFNTSMTGYQEIFTDPSYYGQLMMMTYPHIGNYGTMDRDDEHRKVMVAGVITRAFSHEFSNPLADRSLQQYLEDHKVVGISGVDTRALVRHIREKGVMNAVISSEELEPDVLVQKAIDWEPMEGLELATRVTRKEAQTFQPEGESRYRIATFDYGIKRNIIQSFLARGCTLRVFPAQCSIDEVKAWNADGFFFSNGPGDPNPTGDYALEVVEFAKASGKPLFGICLGHQILALTLGGKTKKMKLGHRGANHPVKNLIHDNVEITSQNHGFEVIKENLPKNIEITHKSLFDNSIEGIKLKNKPVFSVQYHPESNPGPQDSVYLFQEFINNMKKNAKKKRS